MASQDPSSNESSDDSEPEDAQPNVQQAHSEPGSSAGPSRATSPQPTAQKRKRSDSDTGHRIRSKRLKGNYVDDYRVLYNEAIADARARFKSTWDSRQDPLNSQIGSSIWTAQEKAVFFHALQKLGKDASIDIAKAIGTKSVVQVTEYLTLLKDGLIQHVLNDRTQVLYSHADLPAAVEISEGCCRGLDLVAETLAWYQNTYDSKVEKRKHGDFWLLTTDVAERIEESLPEPQTSDSDEESNEDNSEVDSESSNHSEIARDKEDTLRSVPAVELFRLPNWLRLSVNVFMNSPGADNWEAIADPNEEPAIFHTAFHDFHRLAISVIRKLVQASIFQATSRVRAEDFRTSHKTAPIVHAWDVHAAIDILGIKRDAKEFWASAPRRLQLGVYKTRPQRTDAENDEVDEPEQLDMDTVEAYLGPTLESAKRASSPADQIIVDEGAETDFHIMSDTDDTSDSASTTSTSSSDPIILDTNAHAKKAHNFHLADDVRAEALDQQASLTAEHALWQILRQTPPPSSPPPSLPLHAKHTLRKILPDLFDWRDWTKYEPAWLHHPKSRPTSSTNSHSTTPKPPLPYLRRSFKPVPPSQSPKKPSGSSTHTTQRRRPPKSKPRQPTVQERALAKARAIEGRSEDEEEYDDDEEELVPAGGLQPRVLPPRGAREEATAQMAGLEYAAEDRWAASSGEEWGNED